jgi:UDP-N-acetylmuramoyl-L-alanyl-D-glutamate--2,6-diaminopimelate ligase
MQLGRLIDGLDVRLADSRHADLRVCDITEDSRTVLPGSLYIARKGEAADGNDFIPQAVAAGAVAVLSDRPGITLPSHPKHPPAAALYSPDLPRAVAFLAERFYGSPSSKLIVIGVTGTNGKTTTTFLLHQLLNACHCRAGLVGTVVIDDGTETAPASMTTPPALELSRTLARMLEAGCKAAVLEVSSHSLAQGRVAAIQFDAAIFTNLTGDHLDYHRTMDAYADAKAKLFEMLPAGGVAIVNADDAASPRMARDSRAPVTAVHVFDAPAASSTQWPTTVTATLAKSTRWGTDASLRTPWGDTMLHVPFVGRHNVMNATQAIACLAALGQRPSPKASLPAASLTPAGLNQALQHAEPPPGRLQCLTAPSDDIAVYVDYAHTDDALQTVLTVFRELLPRTTSTSAGRILLVFGCGGDRDATKRPRMGAVAASLADRVIVTSDNPRSEDPRAIISAILAGMPADAVSRVHAEPDRERAIHQSISEARPGDVVLIAGKGHEDYQVLPDTSPNAKPRATIKRFFDDRLIARDALKARGISARLGAPRVVVSQATPRSTHAPSPTRTDRT